MTTMTAQFIVGHAHPKSGGINPTHWLYLSENSRPVWILSEENLLDVSDTLPVEWIPTTEHLIEDAILMIGICVLNDKPLKEKLSSLLNGQTDLKARLELSDISEADRQLLYDMCHEKAYHYKIIVSVFSGSSLIGCEDVLTDYGIEHEVCYSTKIAR
ncbi:MAG: hypothetical protein ACRCST_09415 [Turicibacter sp.]